MPGNNSGGYGIIDTGDTEKLQDILTSFDRDFSSSYEARQEAVNDLFFSRVSQWDDWLENFVTLQYRGQFDIVRR